MNKSPQEQTVDDWLVDWELAPSLPNASGKTDAQLDAEIDIMINACKLAPQTHEAVKKENWHMLDCLTKHLLSTNKPNNELRAWFERQDQEWRQARQQLFNKRLMGR